MKNFTEVVATLSALTGIADLHRNDGGPVEIPIDGIGLLEIRPAPDDAIDLVCALPLSIDVRERHSLRVLLIANHLGDGTGAARVGIENHEIILSQRLAIGQLDEAGLQQAIDAFLAHATFWASGEVDQYLVTPPKINFDEGILRA